MEAQREHLLEEMESRENSLIEKVAWNLALMVIVINVIRVVYCNVIRVDRGV